jgi:DNA repair photolyase
VLRDLDVLSEIQHVHALVTFTVTTTDDELARKLEPGAPVSSARFAAMQAVAARGIYTGVSMMPVLPFLEDTPENITAIVRRTADSGGSYIVPWFGLSMRDRQRAYLYAKLDVLFPGLRVKYEQRYGDRYDCPAPEAARLREVFQTACAKLGLADHVPQYAGQLKPEQLQLF